MPYPLDDNGNIRVDFVWGNVPMQPDEQRTDDGADWNNNYNQPGDRGWTAPSQGATSDTLNTTYDQGLSVGDKDGAGASWDDVTERLVVVPSTHDIIKTGYNNFPAYIPDYSGDGDIEFELAVPDLRSLTDTAAEALIESLGLSFVRANSTSGATEDNDGTFKLQNPAAGTIVNDGSTVTATYFQAGVAVPNLLGMNTIQIGNALTAVGLVGSASLSSDGATLLNNGTVKSQAVAAGTIVAPGSTVAYVMYNHIHVTGSIQAIVFDSGLPAGDYNMFLLGRTIKPAVGWSINIAGNGGTDYNGNWEVISVVNDDAYNTGGTKVVIRNITVSTNTTGNGGTWTKNV